MYKFSRNYILSGMLSFKEKHTSIAGSLSSIEEIREGEKDYAKRLDRHDVS